MSFEWARRPKLFFTSPWPSLYFFVYGAAVRIVPELWMTSVALTLAFSCASIVLLFALSRELFDPPAGLIAITIASCAPWHCWLSLAPLAEMGYYAFLLLAILSQLRWIKTERLGTLFVSSLGMFAATGFRYEAWIVALVYAASTCMFAMRARHRAAPRRIALTMTAAVIPLLFPVFLLFSNYMDKGDALYSLKWGQKHILGIVGEFPTLWEGLRVYAWRVVLWGPIVVPLSLISAASLARRKGDVRIWLYFCYGASIMVALVLSRTARSYWGLDRYATSLIIILTPLCAHALARLGGFGVRPLSRARVACALTLLALICSWDVSRAFNFRRDLQHPHACTVGRELRTLIEEGTVPLEGKILVAHTVSKWDGARIGVFSNHPDRFLDPMVFGVTFRLRPDTPMDEFLNANQVAVVVSHGEEAATLLSETPSLRLAKRIGRYCILRVEPNRKVVGAVSHLTRTTITWRDVQVGHLGLAL